MTDQPYNDQIHDLLKDPTENGDFEDTGEYAARETGLFANSDFPDDDEAYRKDSLFSGSTANPYEGIESPTPATSSPENAGAKRKRGRGGSKRGTKESKRGRKNTAGATAVDAGETDTPAKKKTGIAAFFAPKDDTKRGKGHGRKGVTYTRRNGWQTIYVAVPLLAAIPGLAALGIASGKATPGDITRVEKNFEQTSGSAYPKGQAVMFAGQVLRVWGTWDENSPASHQQNLAPFLSAGLDPQGGWNGQGTQTVEYATMNPDPTVSDGNRAIVTGAYQIQDGTWHCAAIPVYAYHANGTDGASKWAFGMAANPTLIPCSPRTGAPQIENYNVGSNMTEDDGTNQSLQATFFPGFMAAWGASDTSSLNQYTIPGVTLTGLGGSVVSTPQPTITSVHLYMPQDSKVQQNTVYKTMVTVQWALTGSDATLKQTYVVPMKETGSRWYAAGEPQPVSQDETANGGAANSLSNPAQGASPGGFATTKPTITTKPPVSTNPKISTSAPSPTSSVSSPTSSALPSPTSTN